MLVNLISRPLADVGHISRTAVGRLADAIRAADTPVVEDVLAIPIRDVPAAVAACTAQLQQQWAAQEPDVVHTFGLVATLAAARAGGSAPIVATFDGHPTEAESERQAAAGAAALMPLSAAEAARWRRLGLRVLPAAPFPLPVPVPDPHACARPGGCVVATADDASLDALIASMPMWAPARLVVLARMGPDRRHALDRAARELGVLDRVEFHPGLGGPDREQVWAGAALLVAGRSGARHGQDVLEAAARGIPTLAVAIDAHLDHVVAGATGMLVEPDPSARTLGGAVQSLLEDSFSLRALGTSALLRIQHVHSPAAAGMRMLAAYGAVVVGGPADAAPARLAPDQSGLAEANLPLARQLAGWYAGRGQSREELVQVASLALVHAAHRFDPSRGKEFHSFAIPTILGELRRHFRDHSWAVHVPRSLQEASLQVQRASDELRQELRHDATVTELSQGLGMFEEEVRRALRTDGEARWTQSLDHPVGDDVCVADIVGDVDTALELVELRRDVRAALLQLPEREQEVLLLRFYGERTQAEIAERLGISQVHVSRVLSRTLAVLRDHVLFDLPLPQSWGHEPATTLPSPRQAS